MRMRVYIVIPTDSREQCESASRSLEPDNASAPNGVEIGVKCEGNYFTAEIVCLDSVSTLTCRNTVDDLLSHLFIALRAVRIINHAFKSSHVA
ncbi:MAG: hypothetical protein GXO32_02945 [Crenarchaeota archaeon]|nr:hypothetical protein [Thermoproteota archaeon]